MFFFCILVCLLLPATALAGRLDPPQITTEGTIFAPDAIIEWEEVPEASYYMIEGLREMPRRSQSKADDDELLYRNDNVVGTRAALMRDARVRPDMVVFVRVCAVDSRGKEGKWSDAMPLNVKCPPPTLESPAGNISDTRTPVFRWTPPNITGYTLELQVSTDQDFVQMVASETLSERDAKKKEWTSDFKHEYLQEYHARMRTRWTVVIPGNDEESEFVSDWTEPLAYTIAYFVPTVESPVEDLIVYTLNPELIFSYSSDPEAWNIQIATANTFDDDDILHDFSLPNSIYYPGTRIDEEEGQFKYVFPLNLAPDRKYFWRLRTVYGEDRGDWTENFSFRLPRPADEAFRATRVEKTADRHEIYPAFSPDGKLLAYNSYPASKQQDPVEAQREDLSAPVEVDLKPVIVANGAFQEIRNTRQAFISELRTPFGPSRDVRPAWMPDSLGLVFASNRYARGNSVTQKNQGSNAMTIIRQSRQDEALGYPAVSPDGQMVALSLVPGEALRRRIPDADEDTLYRLPLIPEGEEMRIWTCNAETGAGFTELVKGVYASFSPDGKTIAYVRYVDRARKIWLYDVETGENRQLLLGGTADTEFIFPTFSPDSSRNRGALAFASNLTGNWDVYFTDLNSGNVTQVTNSLAEDTMPAFTPDARSLIFASKRDASNYDLWYVQDVRRPRFPPTPTPEPVPEAPDDAPPADAP